MALEVLHQHSVGAGPRRPPLLFVHGSYCAAWIWAKPFMPFFAEHGYECHALSLRGHGGSGGVVDWASLADYVADVVEVIDGLDQPPVLIGHSMGGLIAQHVVADGHPVAGLVMLASTPPSGLGSSSLHMMVHCPDVLFQLGLLQSLGPEVVSADTMRRALFSADSDAASSAWMMAHLQKESTRIGTELLLPARPWPPAGGVAALVVGGAADKFLPESAFEEAAAHWRAELHILPGAPHALMADSRYWRQTAEIMRDWLERCQNAVPAA